MTRYADAAGGVPPAALAELRRHFTEPEIAALARAVALEHFFNPVTGALGADAAVSGAAPVRARPLPRAPGTAIRNLW